VVAVNELGVLARRAEDLEAIEAAAVHELLDLIRLHGGYRKASGGRHTSAERRALIGRKADVLEGLHAAEVHGGLGLLRIPADGGGFDGNWHGHLARLRLESGQQALVGGAEGVSLGP